MDLRHADEVEIGIHGVLKNLKVREEALRAMLGEDRGVGGEERKEGCGFGA